MGEPRVGASGHGKARPVVRLLAYHELNRRLPHMLGKGRERDEHRLRLTQGTSRDHFDWLPGEVLLCASAILLPANQSGAVGLEEADATHDLHALVALGDRDEQVRGDVRNVDKREVLWMVLPLRLSLCGGQGGWFIGGAIGGAIGGGPRRGTGRGDKFVPTNW